MSRSFLLPLLQSAGIRDSTFEGALLETPSAARLLQEALQYVERILIAGCSGRAMEERFA